MAGFSVGLQLTDLDDFIAPSQECIKPVVLEKKAAGSVCGMPFHFRMSHPALSRARGKVRHDSRPVYARAAVSDNVLLRSLCALPLSATSLTSFSTLSSARSPWGRAEDGHQD